MIWPQDLMQDLLDKASRGEEAAAELSSKREATLFQWAVKNYKKNHRVGQDVFTKVEGNSVVLRRKPGVKVVSPPVVSPLAGTPPSLVVFFWLEGESLCAATPRLANGSLIQIQVPRAIDPEYETPFEKMVRAELCRQQAEAYVPIYTPRAAESQRSVRPRRPIGELL
jgi:hypothetical protein